MRAKSVLYGLLGLTAALTFVACMPAQVGTDNLPDRGPKTGNLAQEPGSTRESRLRDLQGILYNGVAKPRKIKSAAYLADADLKLAVTDLDADVGLPVKGKKNGGAAAPAGAPDEDGVKSLAKVKSAFAGRPAHDIELDQNHWPVMSDVEDTAQVTDKTTGNVATYAADHEFQNYRITTGGQTVAIRTNPDGTYSVNGTGAGSDESAAKLIVAAPAFQTVSPEGLAVVYALLKNREKQLPATLLPMADAPSNPAPLVRAVLTLLQPKT